jgi:hypothetical protein
MFGETAQTFLNANSYGYVDKNKPISKVKLTERILSKELEDDEVCEINTVTVDCCI